LIADRNLRQTLGLAGLEYALQNFSQDQILKSFEEKLQYLAAKQ
jgi:seryl-tRNA(Sec) selenium transferase